MTLEVAVFRVLSGALADHFSGCEVEGGEDEGLADFVMPLGHIDGALCQLGLDAGVLAADVLADQGSASSLLVLEPWASSSRL